MDKELLTTGEISKYCRVTHRTVLRWIEEGELEACSTPGGHRRILTSSFLHFLNKYKMPVPDIFTDKKTSKIRILVVDDDEALVTTMKRVFTQKKERFEVDSARDGFEAGQKILEFGPDVILLDIQMPRVDGYDVAKRIRENPKTAALPIIAMSGYFTAESKKKIKDCGVNVCLDKPFDIEELVRILERLF